MSRLDCHFYSQNPFLRCAVHPEAPQVEGCGDWKARSPNSNVGNAVDLHGLAIRTVQGFVHLDMDMIRPHLVEITPGTRESLRDFVTATNEAAKQACRSFSEVGVSLEEAQAAIQKLANSSVSVNDIRNTIARLAAVLTPANPKDAAIELISTRHRVSRSIATFRLEDFLSRQPHLTAEVAHQCLLDGRIKFRFGRLTLGKGFPKPKVGRYPKVSIF